MKYWVYLNDEVSQQAYTEDELKQINGFGPDVLICSETSAVSNDPQWKPIKELLPHLIKPKAPNFAKFRPKPPVPAQPAAPQQNVQAAIPQNLPEGVTAVPIEQNAVQPQNVVQTQAPQNDLNAQLLATLEKLNAKISSLENKIEEQEKELIDARSNNKNVEEEDDSPTIISDPINENDDDVLEVPFDNDFDIPFDTPKTSEEIAKEAEAILSKSDSAEIEEYNTDDQKTELMSFGSDMQGILEDTIRENFSYDYEEKVKETKKEQAKDGEIIAEDLVSNTVLNLSAKQNKEENAENKENTKQENKEETEKQENKEEPQEQQEAEQQESEEIIQEEEVHDLDSLLNGTSVSAEKSEVKEKTQEEPVKEAIKEEPAKEEVKEEPVQKEHLGSTMAQLPEEPAKEEIKEVSAQEEHLGSTMAQLPEEPAKEEIKEEPVQEEHLGSTMAQLPEEPAKEEIKEVSAQEEQQDVEEVSETIQENIEEEPIEEAVVEETPIVQEDDEEVVSEEPVTEEIEENEDTPITVSISENTGSESSDDIIFEPHNEELMPGAENNDENNEINNEENNGDNADKKEEDDVPLANMEDVGNKDLQNLETLFGDTQNSEEIKELKIADVKDDVPPTQNIEEKPQEPAKVSPVQETLMASLPDDLNNEEKPELALTMGVTISNDATTAAVLDEIAQEKSLEDELPPEAPEKLFEELENDFNEENKEEDKEEAETVKDNAPADTTPTETPVTEKPVEDVVIAPDTEKQDVVENESEKVTEPDNTTESKIEVNMPPMDVKTPDETMATDDFLKTFATNVEEVFLDQPTAMISDYVPPTVNTDKPNATSLENIKRVKPSDIKTIPLVPEVVGEEIWSSPYVESATANVGKTTSKVKVALFVSLIALISVLFVSIAGTMVAAFFGVIPEKYSPVHIIINNKENKKKAQQNAPVQTMQPEVMEQERAVVMEQPIVNPEETVATDPMAEVLAQVKKYSFPDKTTLEERIKNYNPNIMGDLEWSIFPTEDLDVYSIAIKLPANLEGQSFSYRFNYNVNGGVLTPTTSESKNIMENN